MNNSPSYFCELKFSRRLSSQKVSEKEGRGFFFPETKGSICLKDFPSRHTVAFKTTQVLV